MVKVLVEEAYADVNQRNNPYDDFALLIASKNGHSKVVQYLLSKGANKDLENNVCWSALDWAREEGHSDIVRLLENPSRITGQTAKDGGPNSVSAPGNASTSQKPPLIVAAEKGQLVRYQIILYPTCTYCFFL